jgi:uncharacterized lipoprotein YajG
MCLASFAALLLAGCAQSSAAAPAAPKEAVGAPKRAAHDETVHVVVTLYDLATKATLASTELAVEPLRPVAFQTSQRGSDAVSKLGLRVEPHGELAYAVSVDWDEVTAEGRHVRWAPTLAIAPGATGTAEVVWAAGEGRRIQLRLSGEPR